MLAYCVFYCMWLWLTLWTLEGAISPQLHLTNLGCEVTLQAEIQARSDSPELLLFICDAAVVLCLICASLW